LKRLIFGHRIQNPIDRSCVLILLKRV
jgi:hypothetical protein